jgi:hypothetical protein
VFRCVFKVLGHALVRGSDEEHRSPGLEIVHRFGNYAGFPGKAVEQSNSPLNFGEGHGTPTQRYRHPSTIGENARRGHNVPYRLEPSGRQRGHSQGQRDRVLPLRQAPEVGNRPKFRAAPALHGLGSCPMRLILWACVNVLGSRPIIRKLGSS